MATSGNGKRAVPTAKEQKESMSGIESLLNKALHVASGSAQELESARSSRASAEARLAQAETEALHKAEEHRIKLVAEAEALVKKAKRLNAAAEQDRAEAKLELEKAKKAQEDAEEYGQVAEEEAQKGASQIVAQARETAVKEMEEMKQQAEAEFEKRLRDVELLKAACREELEARRLLTRAVEIRSRYPPLLDDPEDAVFLGQPDEGHDIETKVQPVEPARAKRTTRKKATAQSD
jgi:colicin import membrane protein